MMYHVPFISFFERRILHTLSQNHCDSVVPLIMPPVEEEDEEEEKGKDSK